MRELEALIRLDVKTIYAYVQADRIPHVRIQSNVRFLKREILAWLDLTKLANGPPRVARNHGAAP